MIDWVHLFSPISISFNRGVPVGKFLRTSDPNYRQFDLVGASAYKLFGEDGFIPREWALGRKIAREMLHHELDGKTLGKSVNIIGKWISADKEKDLVPAIEFSSGTSFQFEHRIKNISHSDLMQMYRRCVGELAGSSHGGARNFADMRLAILEEWKRRNFTALNDEYFDWPSTDAPIGSGRLGVIDSPVAGMLRAFGYHVGAAHGEPDHIRRFLLDDLFTCHLPPLHSKSYMDEWGPPSGPDRLKKIANTLASLARNEKRRGLAEAPQQRELDLEYLYKKYYIARFNFVWDLEQ